MRKTGPPGWNADISTAMRSNGDSSQYRCSLPFFRALWRTRVRMPMRVKKGMFGHGLEISGTPGV